ncbi:MAG TPA: hypothetical protein DEQ09_02650, partial [Bacteroidales bacterium]|nr:hypothetical protein [Bacteroidales bacterium]
MAYRSSEGDENWNPLCDLDSNGTIAIYDLHDFAMHYRDDCRGSLSGTVISDVGGPPVEGSLVEVKEGITLISTTTTDAQGNFEITGLTYGTYDIIVTQSGRATSKAQDVHVISSQTIVVNLVQKEVNVPTWETDPPTISTTGIVEGVTLSGTVTCSVGVIDDSDIKYVFIGINYFPSELENDYNTILPSFDTTFFPDGDYQVTVVAYDMNYNCSQLTLNVTIDNGNSGAVPVAPTYLWPVSITLGENISFFSTGRS